MISSLGARASPAHSNQPTAWKVAPPAAGAASIAQMYILRACRGKSPCPLCRLRAEGFRPRAGEGR